MTMHSKPKSHKIQDSLIAAIQRKVPASPAPVVEQAPPEGKKASPGASPGKSKRRIGKPAQFWFHDEDRRILRELAAWLSGQGVRLTDSMVIRAALRTARTGDELLQACRQAAELDGRLKRHKSKSD